MKSSEAFNEIATALAKAQGAIENPAKDSRNPHFNSKYADLAGGLQAIRKGLSINGIAVVQAPYLIDDMQMLDTRLIHTSGQWIGCEWPILKLPAKQQEIGSATTYARRYSLFSLVGIAGEGDDDGNSASQAVPPPPPARKPLPNWTRIKFTFSACNDVTELADKQKIAETIWHFTQEDKEELNRLAAERVKQLATPEVWAEGRE